MSVDYKFKIDTEKDTDEEGDRSMVSGLFLLHHKKLGEDNLFHLGVAGYGEIGCDYIDGTISGHGVNVNCKTGSLYPSADRRAMLVAPETESADAPDIDPDLSWTVFSSIVGAINPYTSAAVAAANIAKALAFDDTAEDINNSKDYFWQYDPPEQSHAAAHYVDFFVLAPQDGKVEITDMFTEYGAANCDSAIDTDPVCDENYTVKTKNEYDIYTSYLYPVPAEEGSRTGEKLSEEEMDELGIPDEIRDKGPIYDTNETATIS
ncbi:hypothetical protein [Natrinema longum]|uniref:Uncharacterized protein n=1 Tax=Natrinema longum TaxID=370324 RepID=A0A8A2UD68_9EURY|nr:hypothetical protein [Natrinema longum]MBZ6495260.1 hypothetical protein [Natrinema longum]QSW86761.1 hypothetical protein J0X27_08100 [Natrinema longum]